MITLTSCGTKETPIPIPFNVTKDYSARKFDTILAIRGDDNTYYFSRDSLRFTHKVTNEDIKTTDKEMSAGATILWILVLVLLFLMLFL